MNNLSPNPLPFGTAPLRWAIRVLSWLAFAVAVYIAWKAVNPTDGGSCIPGVRGCDDVMASEWSKWLGLPVALAGLACYASLAGLSVLLGVTNPTVRRWVLTLTMMLSIVVAGAALWFTYLQFFVLNEVCLLCTSVHVCGILIATLVLSAAFGVEKPSATMRNSAVGMTALRSAMPGAPAAARTAPRLPPTQLSPSWAIPVGGAAIVLSALVGGQVLSSRGSADAQIAANEPFGKNDSAEPLDQGKNDPDEGQVHTAMRPVEGKNDLNTQTTKPGGDSETSPPVGKVEPAAPVEPKPVPSGPPRQRIVSFAEGKISLDAYKYPVLGSPEAPHIVVEFLSYDCHHCHRMHRTVQKALRRYGDQVAVVVVIVPFEMSCNRYITEVKDSKVGSCATARMALAVAALDPAKFAKLHDWIMEDPEKAPPSERVIEKAYGLVGRNRMTALSRDDLNKQLATNVELFQRIKSMQTPEDIKNFGLPVSVLGDGVLSGMPPEGDERVFKAWEGYLGIKPVQSGDASAL